VPPAQKQAASALFQTTRLPVRVDEVAHSAVVVFHVPLPGVLVPFGSQ
jgi:hypothetical protein